jgi:hypothetical protein
MHEYPRAADGVVVQPLDLEVVDLHLDVPARQVGDRHPPTVAGDQDVANTQIPCGHPPAPDSSTGHFGGAALRHRPLVEVFP